MQLRNYQSRAVEAAIHSILETSATPCIVAPTGSGKSVIMAYIIKNLREQYPSARILVLAHVKELILQNCQKMLTVMPSLDVGIYSAGLGRKDKNKAVTFSTVMTAWNAVNNGQMHETLGKMDLIIVDEAHRISPNEDTTYQKLIQLYKDKCKTKVLGLTATPYRTSTGSIISKTGILNSICYEIKIGDLIKDKYISRPITMSTCNHAVMKKVALKNGDFDAKEASQAMQAIGIDAVTEITEKAHDRQHMICFCCSIEHADNVCKQLNDQGISSVALHSESNNNRDEIIQQFKEGKIRCLVNVNILTEGFDAPFIDCVILMRATLSPGLYVQMIGRGFRIAEGKKDFLVLDFGQNIERHGCLDDVQTKPATTTKRGIAPIKICPKCQCCMYVGMKICKNCNYEYPQDVFANITPFASLERILAADTEPRTVKVTSVHYYLHKKEKKTPSIKVIYNTGNLGLVPYQEFICLYHNGFPQHKAITWWHERTTESVPEDINKALVIAKTFKAPKQITVKRNGKFWNIIDYDFGEIEGSIPKTKFDPDEDLPF